MRAIYKTSPSPSTFYFFTEGALPLPHACSLLIPHHPHSQGVSSGTIKKVRSPASVLKEVTDVLFIVLPSVPRIVPGKINKDLSARGKKMNP